MAFALLVPMGAVLAQNISVSGTVTDKNNEPLPGVYVVLQGTKTGTSTDVDGSYVLSAPADGTLLFTSMGMKDVVVPINGKKVINVTMEEDLPVLQVPVHRLSFVVVHQDLRVKTTSLCS